MTGCHQPQHEAGFLGFNPQGASGKDLKRLPHVQASLRAFIGEVIGQMALTNPMMCRFLHQQNPDLWPAPTAAMPATLALPAPQGWSPEQPGAGLDSAATPMVGQNVGQPDSDDPGWLPELDPAATPMVSPIETLIATDYPNIAVNTNGLAAPIVDTAALGRFVPDGWSALAATNFGPAPVHQPGAPPGVAAPSGAPCWPQ